MAIYKPFSPGGGWIEVFLYRNYADLANEHFINGRYFDVIVVSCVGFDVLVGALPGRIWQHHSGTLTAEQKEMIDKVEGTKRLTVGDLLAKLREVKIFHKWLDLTLKGFNEERNRVIHPIDRKETVEPDGRTTYSLDLKPEALTPINVTREDAARYLRYFCIVIDLLGGESPRKAERWRRRHSITKILEQQKEKQRWKGASD